MLCVFVCVFVCRYNGAEEDDGEARTGQDTLGAQENDSRGGL